MLATLLFIETRKRKEERKTVSIHEIVRVKALSNTVTRITPEMVDSGSNIGWAKAISTPSGVLIRAAINVIPPKIGE